MDRFGNMIVAGAVQGFRGPRRCERVRRGTIGLHREVLVPRRAYLWASASNGSNGTTSTAYGVATDSNGNVFIHRLLHRLR